jgi:hypothetical protein
MIIYYNVFVQNGLRIGKPEAINTRVVINRIPSPSLEEKRKVMLKKTKTRKKKAALLDKGTFSQKKDKANNPGPVGAPQQLTRTASRPWRSLSDI